MYHARESQRALTRESGNGTTVSGKALFGLPVLFSLLQVLDKAVWIVPAPF